MKAIIKDKKEVAKGTLRVEFDLLGKKVEFKAGQYFYITILNPPYNDERGAMRHITIVNPPEENDKLVLTTRIRDSAFKKSLVEVPIGHEVQIGGIEGSFTLPESKDRRLVFIAGGIGITPFMSMLSHIRNLKLSYRITLLYSNRDKKSAVYLDDLEEFIKDMPDFKLILTMTEDPHWKGEKRRINSEFLKEYLQNPREYFYYVAGPPGFNEGIKTSLQEADVSKENIKAEKFSGY